MATTEDVINEACALPPEEQVKVLAALERESRLARIRLTQSKFAHLTNSSEDFARRKVEEIALEESKFNRR